MIDRTQVTRVTQSVVEQVHNYMRAGARGLSEREMSRVLGWSLMMFVAVSAMTRVAIAQDQGGIIDTALCGTALSAIVTAVFTGLIIALTIYGVGHLGNGFRKMSGGGSTKVKEGRTEVLYSGLGFAGAILVGSAPSLLGTVGLSLPDCISFAGM